MAEPKWKKVVRRLKENDPELTSLSYACFFKRNGMGEVGATALADALCVNTTLSELELSNNAIGDEGAKALADALLVNTTLSFLGLHGNRIGDEGATALADALRVNTTLSTLCLSDNGIGDEGATALADALRVNTTLSELILHCYNKFGVHGATALVTALKDYNTTLQSVKLRYGISGSLEKQIEEIVSHNKRGTRTDLAQVQANREAALPAILQAEKERKERDRLEKERARLEKQERQERAQLERTEKARLAQLQWDQEILRKRKEEEDQEVCMEEARLEELKRQEDDAKQRQRENNAQTNKDEIHRLAKQQREADAKHRRQEEDRDRLEKARLEFNKSLDEEAKYWKKEEEQRRQEDARLVQKQRDEEETATRNEEDTQIIDSRHALQQSRQTKNPRPVFVTKEYVHSIQTSELLGNGFFGTVHRGYDCVLAIEFAVKTNRVPIHLLDKEQLDRVKKSFRTELETLHAFKHPYIASLYAYHLSPDLKSEQFLVYELAKNGPLSEFLKSDFGRDRLSSFQQRVQIAVEVMTAIQFLHNGTEEIKCFHRDIKADNIVLMADMTAKLIDCGLAKFVSHTGEASATGGGKGTDEYMCPMYQKNMLTEYEAKCDVYSFGVVLAELWIGHLQNHHNHSTGEKVNYYETYILDQDDIVVDMDDALDITDGVNMPTYAVEFAQLSIRCMSRKLKNRPSGSEVLSQLQAILGEREKDTKENADVQEKQEVEYPSSTSIKMQCVECRQEGVRCHPRTGIGYSCLPCLLLDMRRQFILQVIPEIHAARFENRDLHEQSRSENRELHERTQATLNSFSGVLASLDARMVNQIPVLFVLLPEERAKLRQHPRSWLKDKARAKYRIYFVCSHSSRAVKNPLKFRVSKDWVTKIAPLLACSLYALQMAGKVVTGINLDLGAAGTLVENINTEKLSEMLDSVMAHLSEHGSNQELLENLHTKRLDHANIRRLDKESIAPIVELASSQRDWFQEMKHVRHRSSNQVRSMWVLNEYASTNQFETIV